MLSPATPPNEAERQAALDSFGILDSLSEQRYDDITDLAAYICQTPIALITLIDKQRQWFKSHHGLSLEQTQRSISMCAHCILQPEGIMIVPNAHVDARFKDNPLVLGEPYIHFYAGVALMTPEQLPLGTICVISHAPHSLTTDQMHSLKALARQTSALLELSRLENSANPGSRHTWQLT